PILLLRSFRDDKLVYRRDRLHIPFSGPVYFEEFLVTLLSRAGPVIAIGQPGELLPPLGAARFYVGDEWKAKVEELIKQARYVVMVMGELRGSDGLTWEVRKIFETADPERILLIIPPIHEDEARARWDGYQSITG